MEALNTMAEKYNMPVIYSTHPRSRKDDPEAGLCLPSNVRQLEPFGFHRITTICSSAPFVWFSDSGTLPEESAFFNSVGLPFPVVCVRISTERPEALEKGNFIIAGITTK